MAPDVDRRPTERATITRVTGNGPARTLAIRSDELIVEEPLSIQLDGTVVATTMRTPGHDRELAVGFCFTEGLLGAAAVLGVRHCSDETTRAEDSNVVTVDTGAIAPAPTPRLGNVSSSCGWCGSEQLDELSVRLAPLPSTEPIDLDVLGSIGAAVFDGQGLFATTGSVHAAALFDPSGRVVVTREDVGRHNAVDKVVGALALGEDDLPELPATGYGLFVSGRASIEMVQKAWAAGCSTLVAVSAPTALAVDAARRANLVLAGFVRNDGFNLYAPESQHP